MERTISQFTEAGPIDRLSIYLNDHRAGAVAGIALARRCERSNSDNQLGRYLRDLIEELEEDRSILASLMEGLGFVTNPVKGAIAVAAERLGRLKTNGQLRGYSPLSRVEELEALIAGVTTRAQLWRTVGDLTQYPACASIDAEFLRKRAQTQRRALVRHQTAATSEAFLQP